jgi:valyl-tRNA synthetase
MRFEDYKQIKTVELVLIDKWILSKLERLVKKNTEAMENCEFMKAFESTRNFLWHVFCDHWLEAAKTRLYGSGKSTYSAQRTMYFAIPRILKLLAPVMPHITEEIYRTMFSDSTIHVDTWPKYDASIIDEEAEEIGDLIIAVISDIRRMKNQVGISLNKEVNNITLYADGKNLEFLLLGAKDIKDTLKILELEIIAGEGDFKIENYPEIGFTIRI